MISDFMKIDITGYYTILKNAMVRRDYQLNGLDSIMYDGVMSKVQAIQNAAVANVYGIQAGVEFDLGGGFRLTSDFNYQKGEEELDDGTKSPSRHAAPCFGDTKLIYNSGKINLQFYSVYSGKKTYDQLPEEEKSKTEYMPLMKMEITWSPGWYTLNFKADYKFLNGFNIEIWNRKYHRSEIQTI
ncbi:MAG: hypothetical protein R2771_11765 [Saprospiraceae bacterium]